MKRISFCFLLVLSMLLSGCGDSSDTNMAQPYNMLNSNYNDFSTSGLKRKISLITVDNPSLTAIQRGHTALSACLDEQKKSGYDYVKVWLVCDPRIMPILGETVLAEAIVDSSKDSPVWQVKATNDTPTSDEIKLMRAAGEDRFTA